MRDAIMAMRREKALDRIVGATQALGERFGCAEKAAEITAVQGREPIRSMRRMEAIAEFLEVLQVEMTAQGYGAVLGPLSDEELTDTDEAQTDTDEGDTDNAPAMPAVTKAKAAKAKAK